MTDEDGTPSLAAPEAERALLGAVLTQPTLAVRLCEQLDGTEFYEPKHETIWHTFRACLDAGVDPDAVTVTDRLRHAGEHRLMAYLPTLVGVDLPMTQVDEYAATVRSYARARTLNNIAMRLGQRCFNGSGPDLAAAEAMDALDGYVKTMGERRLGHANTIPTIDELLAEDADDTYAWLIPDLLERQDRVILTATEGAGKSTLLRQIAIQVASGVHPFTGCRIPPVKVLVVDVENSRRQSRRKYRPLRTQAGARLDPELLRIEIRPRGLDLTTTEDRQWLTSACESYRPDLLIAGPVYKLANGDPTEEQSSKPVAMAFDAVRDKFDLAVWLEAHSAKAPAGVRHRPIEPYGWSGWLRWPEFGIYLGDDGEIRHWRGQRDERTWPEALTRGGEWPWTPIEDEDAARWSMIRAARVRAGRPLTFREAGDMTGLGRNIVARIIGKGGRYRYEWTVFNGAETTEVE